MRYVIYKRFRCAKTLGGYVNLPRGTECESIGSTIYYKTTPLVFTTSQNAYDYFARDDDGMGLMRGQRITQILDLLRSPEMPVDLKKEPKQRQLKAREYEKKLYDARWQKIWGCLRLLQFRRPEHKDFWIWGDKFYNAKIEDLDYIYNLITEDVKIVQNF